VGWDLLQARRGTQYQTSIIEMLSEVRSSLSPSLNTKSNLQTCGYKTAGGSGVEGSVWVALHSGGGKKQMVTNRAIPLHSSMEYKLASSRRPAKAVGYPAQGRGADGDGGGTAGTSLAGVVAASVTNNQNSENPHPAAPRQRAAGSNHDPPPSLHMGQTSAPKRARGKLPDGAEAEPDDPPIQLTRRSFKIATWNMCGQGTRDDPKSTRKMQFAEQIMTLEDVDILVLTETHTTSLPNSQRIQVLEQSGMAARAGVAILAKTGAGWEVRHKEVIVPGHAVMVQVSHRISRESFWILGVYGDISRGQKSLVDFYERLHERLRAFVRRQARTHWGGCFAAGDWNFVEFAKDRFPTGHTDRAPERLLACFNNIKDLCGLRDTAGGDPAPSLWSYSKETCHGKVYSRLDRVYRPSLGWSGGEVTPIDTGRSDHRLITALVHVRRPKIEKAVPAPRLPEVEVLDKTRNFWPKVLLEWKTLSDGRPVTLEVWKVFKNLVLAIGLKEVKAMKSSRKKDWVDALRKECIPPEQIMSAVTKANRQIWRKRAPPARTPFKWPAAIPAYEVQPKQSRHFVPSKDSPWKTPIRRTAATPHGIASAPPVFAKPPHTKGVADLLQERADLLEKSTKAKWEKMARTHTSEWFKQSSNKEMDERGSRASVSVEGLRRPEEDMARTDLGGMAAVAKEYFHSLHEPEPLDQAREIAQDALLEDVRLQGLQRPDVNLENAESGPFTENELRSLLAKMPNTAPGPDGIPYSFWKRLIRLLDNLQDNDPPPRTFWNVFSELLGDIAKRGSSREGFKDANISLFYKKGDPTLVSNYRPISSMNTDCTMYTNLINARLAPWAVAKLHPDQKGFVPGHLMSEHTRLASEVAHLCDVTGTPGFIVGLDQAKAYDRVDQLWLLKVLVAFGLPADLVLLISDIVDGCRSRVRINSGYSSYFTLKWGVRQGDPLSCLLFNFSIEPLAIKLREKVIGLSVAGLPPVKVMLYADDVNLFLGEQDSVTVVSDCLTEVSHIIGSKFNMDKTDVKPVGPHGFQLQCFADQNMGGPTIPGAHVLPPADLLRILGVWVGSRDHGMQRWLQIDAHIKKIISQWRAIGASARNRSILAKALMLSRCHFLLDGNGIPPSVLRRISNRIMNFVRGKFSAMAYNTLETPLEEGGLNTPSLTTRKYAVDLKFLSDLVTGSQRVPWKRWTWMDLKMATTSSRAGKYNGLNPFLQQAYTMPSLLQDRVSQAFMTARRFGIDLACATPSLRARMGTPILNHPAIPGPGSQRFLKLLDLGKAGVKKVIHLYAPPPLRGSGLKKTVTAMRSAIESSAWSPLANYGSGRRDPSINIWPDMTNPMGCVRVFTAPRSMVSGRIVKDAYKASRVRIHMEEYVPVEKAVLRRRDDIVYSNDIHVWTDGSAEDNGTDGCTAGSAWVSSLQLRDAVSLRGAALSNNVAELAAVVLCLLTWQDAHIVVHTDSTFVLGLLKGGLLAMERDGWGDAPRHMSRGPTTPLLRSLLYLLRDRTGRIRFVKAKAHSDDVMNNLADELAKEGRVKGRPFDIGALTVPHGWVDSSPVLCHQPLDYLTKLTVRARIQAPATTIKFGAFLDRWTVEIGNMFGVVLDPGSYVGKIWSLTIQEGLKEVLWKEMNGAQVLGHRYYSTRLIKSDLGRFCVCGEEMSLRHILIGCSSYALQPLATTLSDILRDVSPAIAFKMLHPDEWGQSPWYPLLALKAIEETALPIFKGRKAALKALKKSRQQREWIIGNYYWALWKWRMKEIHKEKFKFVPHFCAVPLRGILLTPIPAHLLWATVGDEDAPATAGQATEPDQAKAESNLSLLPPPVSLLMGGRSKPRHTQTGAPLLHAIAAPLVSSAAHPLSTRERILRALTDNAYA